MGQEGAPRKPGSGLARVNFPGAPKPKPSGPSAAPKARAGRAGSPRTRDGSRWWKPKMVGGGALEKVRWNRPSHVSVVFVFVFRFSFFFFSPVLLVALFPSLIIRPLRGSQVLFLEGFSLNNHLEDKLKMSV